MKTQKLVVAPSGANSAKEKAESASLLYDIFLSHNHVDEAWTKKLAARLEQEEWQGRKLRVFFSPWDIRPGEIVIQSIEAALDDSRKVGIVVTPTAMQSAWVELEVSATMHAALRAHEHRIIPLYRSACDIPTLLHSFRRIDFRDDERFEAGVKELLAAIKDEPLPREAPSHDKPTRALAPPLPRPPITGFIARHDREGHDWLAQLHANLAPNSAACLALWGPGGVGKTTLAAEFARQWQREHESACVVWSNADGRVNFTLNALLDDIATQLGQTELRPLALEQKREAVRYALTAAPTLLVVDNFESVAEEERRSCSAWLLNEAQCPALITSRDRVEGARNVPVHAMSPEEAQKFLDALLALAQNPAAFTPGLRERLLDFTHANPLMLQWLVAQIDLAQEPETVLEELRAGEGEVAQRIFTRSFELPQVGEDGRSVLLALSLFVPSASRKALAEVAGFGNDLKRLNEALKNLASLWLVNSAEDGRLQCEALTRDLAMSRLTNAKFTPAEVATEFRRRFAIYFLEYATTHAQPTPEDYDALEAEIENMLTVFSLAFTKEIWEVVIALADVIGNPVEGMLGVRGYWEEALNLLAQALHAARVLGEENAIARFAHNLAIMHQNRGDYEQARQFYEESLEIAKRLGDQSGIASSLHQLGGIAQAQGDYEQARQFYEESLEILKRLGKESGIASSLHASGMLAQAQGDYEQARQLYEESLEIAKRLGDQSGIAYSLGQMGILAQDQGDYEQARQLYLEILDINKRLDNQRGIAIILHELGRLAQGESDYEQAWQFYAESFEIAKRLGDQSGIAGSLHQLGNVAFLQGDYAQARQFYEESLEIAKRLGDQGGIAISLGQLGLLAETEGNLAEAKRLSQEALLIFEKLKSPNTAIARASLQRVAAMQKKATSQVKARSQRETTKRRSQKAKGRSGGRAKKKAGTRARGKGR